MKTTIFFLSFFLSLPLYAISTYDELFPTYIESCAGTQEKPLKTPQGGIVGHSFVYIRGACRDEKADYPHIRPCTGNDKSQGVGLSVDQVFNNVNWVAIDDRDLFFNGLVGVNQSLDEQAQEKTVQEALKRKLYQNIKIRPEFAGNFPRYNGESDEEWLAREGVGTNYAINFHRNILCTKIPMPMERIQRVIDYANSLNDKYFLTGQPYTWSRMGNNCTHFAHNVLAAAGVFGFKKTDAIQPLKLLNIAIPANEWVMEQATASKTLQDLAQIYKNPLLRQNIFEGWLPTQAGAIIEEIPIHDYMNSLADINSTITMIDIPYIGFYVRNVKKFANDPRYYDLHANLLAYQKIYERILSSSPSMQGFALGKDAVQLPEDFDNFYAEYLSYIQKQLNFVNQSLNKLR